MDIKRCGSQPSTKGAYSIEILSIKMKSVQRCEMMKEWVHVGNGPWISSVQEPASSWGSLVASRYRQM